MDKQELVSIEIMRAILLDYLISSEKTTSEIKQVIKIRQVLDLSNQSVIDNFEVYIVTLHLRLEEANEFAMKKIMMNYYISNGVSEQTANNFKFLNAEETLESFRNLIKAMEYFLERGREEYKNEQTRITKSS